MAYPTGITWFFSGPALIGAQPITETRTVQAHPLGTRVRATDANLGECEFIYAKGVASTAAGDLCVINTKATTTTRAVHSTGNRGMLGISMSANVASSFGWYMIQGAGPVASTTGTAANAVYLTSTAGTTDSVDVATDRVDNAWYIVTGTGGFSYVALSYPFAHGSGGD